jgi:hypothetical protein
MFRTVRLSIIRSLFTVHSVMVYVIQVCRQISSRTRMELQFHPGPARKLSVWHISLLSLQWINSWWWTDEMSETRRVSWQNKFVKLVHLVGFVTKKFVTMHSHMNVKKPAATHFVFCSRASILRYTVELQHPQVYWENVPLKWRELLILQGPNWWT